MIVAEKSNMKKADFSIPLEFFLENESVSLTNRMVVAASNTVCENFENMTMFSDLLGHTFEEHFQSNSNLSPKNPDVQYPVDFYEKTILGFSCKEYEARFKMKKSTCQALINFLKDCQRSSSSLVSIEKKVHVFLWLLTSEASFNEVGTLFALHKSSVAYIFHEVASLLSENKYNFIIWPSTEMQHLTSMKVNSNFKFPNCVGFIDACPFKVGSKRNKSKQPETILLQAVCADTLMFVDIHVGPIGVTKKSTVYRDSSLSHELKNYVEFKHHILGDHYKLRKNLITPFKIKEFLTNEELRFNKVHFEACSYIRRAFDLMNEKFVKLHLIDFSKPEAITGLLSAACVLHNFILLHEGQPVVKQETVVVDDVITIDKNIIKTATDKRQFLCNYINYIDMIT